jgi:hypothetical protein
MNSHRPDFDELVGTELDRAERERLLRVHELLVSVGPPPDLPETLEAPATSARVYAFPRRRGFLTALAAALAVALFAVGFIVGNRSDDRGTFELVTMSGSGATAGTSATIEIFDIDEAGNWPMEVRVDGLGPSASGKPYELWLTRDAELAALCGSFLGEPDGTTVVPMNAPYKLSDFDGWVVVEEGSEVPLLTT